ncbi:hypothetical protein M0802_011267 [Mischocyttarus mexicanus]|nr:hypothetical protein M0802_011267 [Mischocyttarus mexicanus]
MASVLQMIDLNVLVVSVSCEYTVRGTLSTTTTRPPPPPLVPLLLATQQQNTTTSYLLSRTKVSNFSVLFLTHAAVVDGDGGGGGGDDDNDEDNDDEYAFTRPLCPERAKKITKSEKKDFANPMHIKRRISLHTCPLFFPIFFTPPSPPPPLHPSPSL